MRNVGFLALGLLLLMIQSNAFRLLEVGRFWFVAALWILAVVIDTARTVRRAWPGAWHARTLMVFRANLSLPATVLLGYSLLTTQLHVQVGRPIPGLALPLILFMGVHEYSLAAGALVAFALGYATDVLGIAPVGLYTFTYVATFVLARAAGVRLAAQTAWMQALLVGAFAFLQSTMVLVLLAIFGRDPWVPRALYPLVIPHAVATSAVAPVLFGVCQALHTATAGATRPEPVGAGVS